MKLTVAQLVIKFAAFNKPEVSLPCPQKPATGPYLEPRKPVLHPHTLYF